MYIVYGRFCIRRIVLFGLTKNISDNLFVWKSNLGERFFFFLFKVPIVGGCFCILTKVDCLDSLALRWWRCIAKFERISPRDRIVALVFFVLSFDWSLVCVSWNILILFDSSIIFSLCHEFSFVFFLLLPFK